MSGCDFLNSRFLLGILCVEIVVKHTRWKTWCYLSVEFLVYSILFLIGEMYTSIKFHFLRSGHYKNLYFLISTKSILEKYLVASTIKISKFSKTVYSKLLIN